MSSRSPPENEILHNQDGLIAREIPQFLATVFRESIGNLLPHFMACRRIFRRVNEIVERYNIKN